MTANKDSDSVGVAVAVGEEREREREEGRGADGRSLKRPPSYGFQVGNSYVRAL